jgi:hypothetical protein
VTGDCNMMCESAQERREHRRCRQLAEQAWQAASCAQPGACGPDYAQGFKDGFVSFAESGGNGQPPLIPPHRYWHRRYETPEGLHAVESWYAGFVQGSAAAQAGGNGPLEVIPTPTDGRPLPPTLRGEPGGSGPAVAPALKPGPPPRLPAHSPPPAVPAEGERLTLPALSPAVSRQGPAPAPPLAIPTLTRAPEASPVSSPAPAVAKRGESVVPPDPMVPAQATAVTGGVPLVLPAMRASSLPAFQAVKIGLPAGRDPQSAEPPVASSSYLPTDTYGVTPPLVR